MVPIPEFIAHVAKRAFEDVYKRQAGSSAVAATLPVRWSFFRWKAAATLQILLGFPPYRWSVMTVSYTHLKVLRAAAMTYVAATFTSLMTLLRLLAIAGNRRGRD